MMMLLLWMKIVHAAETANQSMFDQIDTLFGTYLVGPLATVMFFDLAFWDNGTDGEISLPAVVVWLLKILADWE